MNVGGEAFLVKEKKRIEVFLNTGQFAKARKSADRLCKKFRDNPEAWFLLAAVCSQQSDFKQAVVCCKKTVQLAPHVVIGYFNLALAQKQSGELKAAALSLLKVIELQPEMPEAYRELGTINHAVGDIDAALLNFQKLAQLLPKDISVWISLGNLYEQKLDLEEAKSHYQKACELDPASIAAGVNLGNTLKAQGKHIEAEQCYEQLIKLRPDNVDVLYSLALLYQSLYQYADAEELYEKILTINPLHIASQNNLAVVLMAQNRPDESITLFEKIIKAQPENNEAKRNLANIYREQNKLQQAEALLTQLIDADTNNTLARQDRALVWLQKGLFDIGWAEYESRLVESDEFTQRWPFVLWEGQDIAEKTLLIFPEQGVGDEIMFSSCIKDILKKSKKVVLVCDERLQVLFQRSFAGALVLGRSVEDAEQWLKQLPSIDYQISIASLPRYFRTEITQYSNNKGYIQVDAVALEKWKKRFELLGEGCKVGISWRGGHISTTQAKRSIQLEQWQKILKLSNVSFINLQYGDCEKELLSIEQQMGIKIYDWDDSNPLVNIDDFAAKIKALDLVVSIDNSTVHLSAALDVATWVLQPFSPDWRWFPESADSYWYPSVTQFKQHQAGNWDNVINEVSTALEIYKE